MNKKELIFVVDDDPVYAEMLKTYLEANGYLNVEIHLSGKSCLNNIFKKPSLILLDYFLEDSKGIDVLIEVVSFDANLPVIFLSGQESVQTAIDTLKYGAFDYVAKNDQTFDRLTAVIGRLNQGQDAVLKYKKNRARKKIAIGVLAVVIVSLTFYLSI